ncbi:PhzF family phenazine biosynthesis protein [Neorhizobium alkalisoli]|uniref:PhzF family phenazine biosynthesis protein n=1 Tax=Neorhizobium alkalisoli TaxID=528178 RepID=A0A561R1H1_9HYPH|nr:PhzF family phenazine biosynthesis protein [Neorhizobium alkalisoli]TWF56464.1 PhzF family phenazine biosynthesis protein [Neorhizobium alkalisoli]
MPTFSFQQVDVFSSQPMRGNPLAVVIGADALSDAQMQAFANWTNLSETTFLLQPTDPTASYRVRIFTPSQELPFAGHPTLGSAHVWLSQQATSPDGDIVQECGAGLVRIRRDGGRLAFAAPPLTRSGPVDPALIEKIAKALGIPVSLIIDSNWCQNGPDWIGVLLPSRANVLAVKPDYSILAGTRVGLVGRFDPSRDGDEALFEVRAFTRNGYEDPVTGSLNAGLAQWLIGAGVAPESYVAAQGTVLGRAGRVHVDKVGEDVWVGGEVATCIAGTLTL